MFSILNLVQVDAALAGTRGCVGYFFPSVPLLGQNSFLLPYATATFLSPVLHPPEPDCHPEDGGGSKVLQNIATHLYYPIKKRTK